MEETPKRQHSQPELKDAKENRRAGKVFRPATTTLESASDNRSFKNLEKLERVKAIRTPAPTLAQVSGRVLLLRQRHLQAVVWGEEDSSTSRNGRRSGAYEGMTTGKFQRLCASALSSS